MAIILKSKDAGSTVSVECSTVEDSNDNTDDHWAPLHEFGKTTDVTDVVLAVNVKDFLEFHVKSLSWVRVRAKNTVNGVNAKLVINSRLSTRT